MRWNKGKKFLLVLSSSHEIRVHTLPLSPCFQWKMQTDERTQNDCIIQTRRRRYWDSVEGVLLHEIRVPSSVFLMKWCTHDSLGTPCPLGIRASIRFDCIFSRTWTARPLVIEWCNDLLEWSDNRGLTWRGSSHHRWWRSIGKNCIRGRSCRRRGSH